MILAAGLILTLHLAWLVLIVFGAFWTRGRPWGSTIHVLALLWGILGEVTPWQCPLTSAEQYFESKAGWTAYNGSFLLHYLDDIVYPNLPAWIVSCIGVAVCAVN